MMKNELLTILLFLSFALGLSSCGMMLGSRYDSNFRYLNTQSIQIAPDTSFISCSLPEFSIKVPINTIRLESFAAPLFITYLQKDFRTDLYWSKRMEKFGKKYFKKKPTLLFSISGYMTAFLVEDNNRQAVQEPIQCVYKTTAYPEQPYYLIYLEKGWDYSPESSAVFRSVIELPSKREILVIDRKYVSDNRTLVCFYLLHSTSRGINRGILSQYHRLQYIPQKTIFNPIKHKCEAYQTIARVFDPILDKVEILYN